MQEPSCSDAPEFLLVNASTHPFTSHLTLGGETTEMKKGSKPFRICCLFLSSAGRTRTCNPAINSRMLYH
jgi:hypothetical protein